MNPGSPRPRIGGHVSVAGGLVNAIWNAQEIGAECIQIFGASPRQWHVRGHTEEEVTAFTVARDAAGIGPVFLHGSYLVNLASPDPEARTRSERNLSEHLAIAETIGAEGLIFHIGSGKEMPKADAHAIVVEALWRVLDAVPGTASLIIENSAGGGQKIGATPEDIGEIIEHADEPRLRVCWDTAHAFEAGIIETYTPEALAELLRRMEASFGLNRLVALHVNDSKTPFNSRHDRHENLGEGYIGIDGFRALAREMALWKAAWILEVPGFNNEGPDTRNVDILKECFK